MNPTNNDPVTPDVNNNPTPAEPPVTETPTVSEAPFTASPEPVGTPQPFAPAPEAAPATPFDQTTVAPAPVSENPVQPAEPTIMGAPVVPTPSPKKKKTILIAAIVGGALILVAAAVVVWMLLTTVSKADYQAAATQFTKVSTANSSLNSDLSSFSSSLSTATDEKFNEKASDVDGGLKELTAENESLGKLKAVRVGEGAELYKEFNTKMKAYISYGNEMVTSVKNLRPAFVVCDKISDAKDAAARVTELNNCSDKLSGIGDIPNADLKTFVASLSDNYKKYATVYGKVSAMTNPFSSANYPEYKKLSQEMRDIQTAISDASKKFRDSVKQHDEEKSVKDSADKLRTFLNDKQKG